MRLFLYAKVAPLSSAGGDRTGFDIVIGNPPYGAEYPQADKKYFQLHYQSAQTISGIQKGSLDTFTLFLEKGFELQKTKGNLHYIVPLSVATSESMTALHKLLFGNCETIKISNYAKRPIQIFASACTANSIIAFTKTNSQNKSIFSTKINRLSKNNTLENLLKNLSFADCKKHCLGGRISKIGCNAEKQILDKIFSKSNLFIKDLIREKGKAIYYRTSGGRYFNVITNYPTGSTKEKPIYFDERIANSVGACLSSSIFWWFQQVYTNTLDLKMYEIVDFSIPSFTNDATIKLENLYSDYLFDIERNANVRLSKNYTNVDSFKEYKIGKSKHFIDRIDDLICPLYGLTKEELNFIKNYEIEFRWSDND